MPDLLYEHNAYNFGWQSVAGVDEAGRGPLAGPVTAAAVILPKDFQHSLLNDSKKLSEKNRELLFQELTSAADVTWSIASASAKEIDELNILKATHLAMERALTGLSEKPDYALIDGLAIKKFFLPHEGIVKGDQKSLSISAASILAKVTRDRWLIELDQKFPEYEFNRHKGYGTKIHLEALKKYGPCEEHRQSFAPVRNATPSL